MQDCPYSCWNTPICRQVVWFNCPTAGTIFKQFPRKSHRHTCWSENHLGSWEVPVVWGTAFSFWFIMSLGPTIIRPQYGNDHKIHYGTSVERLAEAVRANLLLYCAGMNCRCWLKLKVDTKSCSHSAGQAACYLQQTRARKVSEHFLFINHSFKPITPLQAMRSLWRTINLWIHCTLLHFKWLLYLLTSSSGVGSLRAAFYAIKCGLLNESKFSIEILHFCVISCQSKMTWMFLCKVILSLYISGKKSKHFEKSYIFSKLIFFKMKFRMTI